MKSKTFGVFLALLALSLFLTGCGLGGEFSAEIAVMNEFSGEFDAASVSVLDKYEISEKEYFYYVRWIDAEGSERETLMIYDLKENTAKAVPLSEMSEETETSWNEIKNARPDRSFSESEINKIITAD